jgi:two-component system sensor histidine kinase/response regulator
VIALFGVLGLLIVAILVALIVSVTSLRSSDRTVRRSSDLLAQSYADERTVVDLDTQLRGFLLTGQSAFLSPYRQDQAALPGGLARLRLLAKDSAERRRIQQVTTGVDGYLRAYARPLVGTGGRLSKAVQARATARGEALVAALHRSFGALDARILKLSERQRADANDAASRAILVAALGLGVAVLLLLGVGVYLIARVLHPVRRVAKAAGRLARGDLDTRVPESGHGEVARLGHSFNDMAASIQQRDAELLGTQRQLAQAAAAAEEASAMKSNFLANMSHETRTPLNGVIGMLSLLSDTRLSVEQREYVDVARASSDALMTVVNDVLDVAKIEAGRLELERRDFDLHDLVETSCDMVAATALSKGVELQSFVREDVPRAVCGDRMRVGQILANLLSNAVKFTAQGEVVVEVSLAAPPGEVIRVRFEVRDTGIGIDPAGIDKLFEPFVQADAGTTREFGGTGLGLAISRELTQLMGGTMEAESERAQGSTFRFEIPFAPARAPLRLPVPTAELRGLHVLVVDDNQTNRQVFEAYVASWSMRAETARDAPDAITRLQRAASAGDPFDVALLDLNMPGESGLELARRITASSTLRHTRLILLTSSGGHPDADDPASGIRSYLVKPVRQSRLLDAISAAMAVDDRAGSEATDAPAAVARGGGSLPAPGARVLVAEDQPANWMLVQRMLAKRGHRATNAVDGRQVLALLQAEPFDLIFMDCQMPMLDGYDTTREIRAREAAANGRRVPIVAMTANAMLGDRERCLAAGMDDYIAKPISLDTLDEMLNRWLPAAPRDQAEVLDRVRLSELRELFPGEEMSGMLHNLVAELDSELQDIDVAVGNADNSALASAAHRLKNSAQMVGAHQLADAAAHLTARARTGQAGAGSIDGPAVAALRVQWSVTRSAIEAEAEAAGV